MQKTNLKAKKPLTRTKAPRKNTTSLKKKADKLFSLAVRYRDCEYTNGVWHGNCITCNKTVPLNRGHAGHFMSRRYLATRWDDMNVNLQCLTAESNLRLFNGKNKSIAKIAVGDELWAFNKVSFSLEKALVRGVSSFVPETLYEVTMEDGSKFYATADHRVVANNRWVRIDSMLHNVSAYDILEL